MRWLRCAVVDVGADEGEMDMLSEDLAMWEERWWWERWLI
jgi:hypothetical protein